MSQPGMTGAVVGCHGIGRMHAAALSQARQVELVALCDVRREYADQLAEDHRGVAVYEDYADMLGQERPDIVALAVPTDRHASMAIQAAEAGVKGICGEKPMARNMSEAGKMMEVCNRLGTHLIVNHQRRTYPALRMARMLIEKGAIGDVRIIRASCPGDILTDGTHAIDSARYLAGDANATWVFGNVYRRSYQPDEKGGKGCVIRNGYRYRHACPIEDGGVGIWEFENGIRAELFSGTVRIPGRAYQDYEVVGSKGVLWRRGDTDEPNLLMRVDDSAGWVPVHLDDTADNVECVARNYDGLAGIIASGSGHHPLAGTSAQKTLEIIMAIYESARLGARIDLPLQQDRYPMDIMDEEEA